MRRGDGGFACLNLRLSMALPLRTYIAGYPRERNSFGSGAAFEAGLGAVGLPCVALFLPNRSAPQARSNPPFGTI